MPIYAFECDEHGVFEMRRGVEFNKKAPCPACDEDASRVYSAPFVAAIPGIPNRINKDWDETGRTIYDPKRPDKMAPKWDNRRQMRRPLRDRDDKGNPTG